MKLTPQEQKVYAYIRDHRGCTTRDIQRDLLIECPSARITGLRRKGVDVQEIGKLKYPGARPFTKYAIGAPQTKRVQHIEIVGGMAVRTFRTVLDLAGSVGLATGLLLVSLSACLANAG